MPADSEITLPHTWRPFGVRMAGTVLGLGLLLVVGLAWIGFDDETQAKFTPFQRGTVVAIGLLGFAVWFALVRSRVVAEEERLVVVNGYKRRQFEYAEVVGVHLPPGAPWVTLDLASGATVSAMGIQGSDGNRAKQAVRELRTVVERQS
ncbi:PH domain-containing protein [Nocardioides caricicola]|uniref:PH domain-containing protein n=1 Tax=Nocardioides caricicola TaxID=634770 RepID=A0ABW0N6M1_9ACTN